MIIISLLYYASVCVTRTFEKLAPVTEGKVLVFPQWKKSFVVVVTKFAAPSICFFLPMSGEGLKQTLSFFSFRHIGEKHEGNLVSRINEGSGGKYCHKQKYLLQLYATGKIKDEQHKDQLVLTAS